MRTHDIVYTNLENEMQRKNISVEFLARQLGLTVGSTRRYLRGEGQDPLLKAYRIKEILGTDMTIDELFSKEIR